MQEMDYEDEDGTSEVAQFLDWVDRMAEASDWENGTEGVWDYPPNDPLHMRLHTREVEHPDVRRVKYGKDIEVLTMSMFRTFVAAGWPEERAARTALDFQAQRQDRRPRRG